MKSRIQEWNLEKNKDKDNLKHRKVWIVPEYILRDVHYSNNIWQASVTLILITFSDDIIRQLTTLIGHDKI